MPAHADRRHGPSPRRRPPATPRRFTRRPGPRSTGLAADRARDRQGVAPTLPDPVGTRAPTAPPAPGALRVLLVDSGREWRGGQAQVHLLAREMMRDSGVAVRLVTHQAGELARRARADGVAVHGAPWWASLDPRAWWVLRREVRRFRPTILHAHDSHALLLSAWAARGVPAPAPVLVATRRVDFHLRRSGLWRRAAGVIAVSEAVRRVLVRDGVPDQKIVVVRDGVDAEAVRGGGGDAS